MHGLNNTAAHVQEMTEFRLGAVSFQWFYLLYFIMNNALPMFTYYIEKAEDH